MSKKNTLPTVELSHLSGVTRAFTAGDIISARAFLIGGNCHSLAAAVHHLSGYAIGCFRALPHPTGLIEHEPHIRHVAAISPEGWVLDGYGVTALSEVTAQRHWSVELYANAKQFKNALEADANEHGRFWMPLDVERLLPFAAAILHVHNS